MQDWFFVQSAEYGRYYIDVEINGYDVYKVSLYVQDEPGSATLGFPYDETTTGKKEYAKRRYKQFMKKAEADEYGVNTYVENPTWVFDQSDWESTQQYIFSSSKSGKSNYQFKWIEDEYLGGNMIAVYGQLTNGGYFYTNDSNEYVWFLNADPKEMVDTVEDDYWYDWLEEYEVDGISDQEYYKFWISIFRYCQKTGYQLYTYEDLDYAISEFKRYC